MAEKFGYPEAVWNKAKAEMRALLVGKARLGEKGVGLIPYSALVSLVETIRFEPHDARFFQMLGEISKAEDAAGRGMLSAVVIHKGGDWCPGPGFFELAKDLGKDTSDSLKCWVAELRCVWDYWVNH